MNVRADERIFVFLAIAAALPPGSQCPVPPRAQAAHQMASTAFANLVRLMDGRPLRAFHYKDHGLLVSLSRFSTVGSLMGSLIGGGWRSRADLRGWSTRRSTTCI